MTKDLVKCEKCLSIKPLARYTKFEVRNELIAKVCDDSGCNIKTHILMEDIGEKRGLCVECSEETAKKDYDKRS